MTKSETAQRKYQELVESLKTQRDELKVKMHLASMEALDEWRIVEDKWQNLQSKGGQIEKEMGGAAHELGEAVSLLGQELKEGYKKIRKLI